MHTDTLPRAGLLLTTAAALVLGGCGTGTSSEATDATSAAVGRDVVAAEAPDATGTGIQVHGAWQITVRDPDGTVASDTHFHNDLVDNGARTLAALIGAPGTTLDTIRVQPVNSTLCDVADTVPAQCEFDGNPAVVGTEAVLTVEIIAPADGTVDRVLTRTQYFFEGTRRSSTFTDRTLDTPVSYVAGQSVTITVRISFS